MTKPGTFGRFGGRWVPETLMPALERVAAAYEAAQTDPTFAEELRWFHQHLGGRPTPLYRCQRLVTPDTTIWLKREDLVHGGAHKFNNVMGQLLLAKRMGVTRIIAETGAGQHGVATAMAGAVLGLEVVVYMGAKDVERQALNVFRMGLHGARVVPVHGGNGTLKDAVNEAMRAWSADPDGSYYCIGSVVGPHPFPTMVRDFQRIIGDECLEQFQTEIGTHPDVVLACVGGGSNAIGIFYPLLDTTIDLVGVEAGGEGVETGKHAAVFAKGAEGILHGSRTYVYQDDEGQVIEPHSVSAGLDYPGVGPEHAHLFASGRVQYVSVTDQEALDATLLLARKEGILPALESAHAVAHAWKLAHGPNPPRHIVVNLSGRGDKDVTTLRSVLGDQA